MVHVNGEWVDFRFYRPGAEQVFVAGDFNDWRPGEVLMKRDAEGHWTTRMRLPAGEYRFKYCADGEWFADYAASGLEPGRFGMDSIVRVTSQAFRVHTVAKPAARESFAASA
jgi:1,4-alpha-glucan branching enzyme